MKRSRRESGARKRRSGQTMPEYVILAGFIVIALAAIFGIFPEVLNRFCYVVLHIVCSPLL
jgi:hypothetical protein